MIEDAPKVDERRPRAREHRELEAIGARQQVES
jgi:hypothetical protein